MGLSRDFAKKDEKKGADFAAKAERVDLSPCERYREYESILQKH